ncbi:MAG: DUF721 domain-containing protein [Bacteroidales bacterium]
MRRRKTQALGDVLEAYINALGIHHKMQEIDVTSSWERVAGKLFASYTTSVEIQHKVLFVKVNSPMVRSELSMHRHNIVKRMNEIVGREIINDVVIR